jgi:tRNA (guanine-N7-)-methyltransferase
VFRSNDTEKTGNSSQVRSNQAKIHPRLHETVQRHLASAFLKPLHKPTVQAFSTVIDILKAENSGQQMIFDSGCGTGQSTRNIAAKFSDHLIFGIDRSIHRLQKTGNNTFPCREENIIWVQAELVTFWRLACQNDWTLDRHFLLYPNPYPKASQLLRRWHAHPVFPCLLALGGILELRSNWEIYAEEFADSIAFVSGRSIEVEPLESEFPVSAFEKKYLASGHSLYRVIADATALAVRLPEFIRNP